MAFFICCVAEVSATLSPLSVWVTVVFLSPSVSVLGGVLMKVGPLVLPVISIAMSNSLKSCSIAVFIGTAAINFNCLFNRSVGLIMNGNQSRFNDCGANNASRVLVFNFDQLAFSAVHHCHSVHSDRKIRFCCGDNNTISSFDQFGFD